MRAENSQPGMEATDVEDRTPKWYEVAISHHFTQDPMVKSENTLSNYVLNLRNRNFQIDTLW